MDDKTRNRLHVDKWMRYEDDIIRYYYKQLHEWLESKPRKPAVTAFTSGLGRYIARLCEEADRIARNDEQESVKETGIIRRTSRNR